MKHIQTFSGFLFESSDIVSNNGNGKIINEIWKEWNSIKTDKDWNKWAERVKNTKFGTYGTISFLETLERFEPNYPNSIMKKNFIEEIHQALEKR